MSIIAGTVPESLREGPNPVLGGRRSRFQHAIYVFVGGRWSRSSRRSRWPGGGASAGTTSLCSPSPAPRRPTCARHGVLRGQTDISARLIWIFERFGWVHDVRWPTPARLAKLTHRA